MAMNRIQFQPGLSLPAFHAQFGTDGQCADALEASRWPQGFRCSECGDADYYLLKAGRGSENKVPFVAAISLSAEGRPLYIKMAPVSGFTRKAIVGWANADLSPGCVVTSDGLG